VDCPDRFFLNKKGGCVDFQDLSVPQECCDDIRDCKDEIKEVRQDYVETTKILRSRCGFNQRNMKPVGGSNWVVTDSTALCTPECLDIFVPVNENDPEGVLHGIDKECRHLNETQQLYQSLLKTVKVVSALCRAREACREALAPPTTTTTELIKPEVIRPKEIPEEKGPIFEIGSDARHIAFILDASHSMWARFKIPCEKVESIRSKGLRASVHADGSCSTSRVDYMRNALIHQILALKPHQQFSLLAMQWDHNYPCRQFFCLSWNFLFGDRRVFPRRTWWNQMDYVNATGRNQELAIRWILDMRPSGQTPMEKALNYVLDFKQLDTVYLLSDGLPNVGCTTLDCMPYRWVHEPEEDATVAPGPYSFLHPPSSSFLLPPSSLFRPSSLLRPSSFLLPPFSFLLPPQRAVQIHTTLFEPCDKSCSNSLVTQEARTLLKGLSWKTGGIYREPFKVVDVDVDLDVD
jgi:hypothetical protein